jgi:NAD(P)-dependent dehydrogenase (short-subunit alcohol dehydrogenase family)
MQNGSRKFTGKVALITGGNRGIGLETAKELGRLGMTVVLAARDTTKGEAAAKKLREADITAESLKLDVTNPADYRAAYEYLDKKFGKLDVLVNNAGVMLESMERNENAGQHTSKISPEVLRGTFDANFFAPIALTQALLPLIRKSDAGRIVNLSSILGSLTLHADPKSPIYDAKTFAYDASKTALNAFTVHLAHELKDTPIKVNSAHPGWVQTEMGGPNAPMPLSEGGRTSVQLATLPADGPSGGFFHLGERLPW